MSEKPYTYAELAELLRTTPEGARQQAVRRRWRKGKDNEGRVIVYAPDDELARLLKRRPDGRSTGARAAKVTAPPPNDQRTADLFERALNELREQLERARQTADRAHEFEVANARLEGEVRLLVEQRDRSAGEASELRAARDRAIEELADVRRQLSEASRAGWWPFRRRA